MTRVMDKTMMMMKIMKMMMVMMKIMMTMMMMMTMKVSTMVNKKDDQRCTAFTGAWPCHLRKEVSLITALTRMIIIIMINMMIIIIMINMKIIIIMIYMITSESERETGCR